MTKQEFIQRVSAKSGLNARDAGKAVDAFLETVTDGLKSGDSINFTGFGKFSAAAARRAAGRQPPDRRARPHRRDHRAEVQRRQPAQGGGEGGLNTAPGVTKDPRPGPPHAAPVSFRGRSGLAVAA